MNPKKLQEQRAEGVVLSGYVNVTHKPSNLVLQ